jgi:hypothetical protein
VRKHQRYGTVLIALERRQSVALLPERTADTVAQWLREHPGVKVIMREREFFAVIFMSAWGNPKPTSYGLRLGMTLQLCWMPQDCGGTTAV